MSPSTLAQGLVHTFVRPDLRGPVREQRWYLALTLLVGLPTATVFFLADAMAGRPQEATANLAVILAAVLALGLNRYAADPRWGARCVAGAALAVFTWMLYFGGAEGLGFVWFYFLPTPFYYLLGSREGSVWFALSFATSVVILNADVGQAYSGDLGIRFAVSYGLVGLLALGMERSRIALLGKLDDEKQDLEAALGEIRTLRESVPMCAWCRKVRDDDGAWSQIEEYLDRQIGTRFSHGVCPDCAAQIRD